MPTKPHPGELHIGRRELIAAGASLASLTAGCSRPKARGTSRTPERSPMTSDKMPTIFLPHGGGPWPFMDDRVFGAPGMWDQLAEYLRQLRMTPPATPAAVLVVSAHWEARRPTVMNAAAPPMLYDYHGFPPETYEVQWPAPGAVEVAAEIRRLLEDSGFATDEDPERGYDHGTFVPLALTYPEANIPTTQLSLVAGLDPAQHIALGRALAPLRDQGVLIVGSGMSYHNLRALTGRGGREAMAADSRAFDDWLAASMSLEADARESELVQWERAPAARACHPREEHLLPLMVVAGAAENEDASLPFRESVMGAQVSAVHFG